MAVSFYEEKGRKYCKIDDVVFGKLSIRYPEQKYGSTDKIFRAECIVSKADYKEIKKKLKKSSFEEIDTSEFEGRLRFAPPYPDQDEQFVVRFSAKTTYKDKKTGEQKPLEDGMELRPKVFEVMEDGSSVEITKTKYINNGSKGSVILSVSEVELEKEKVVLGFLKSVTLTQVNEYIKPE